MKKTLILTVFLLLSFLSVDAQVSYTIEEAKEIIAAEKYQLEQAENSTNYEVFKLKVLTDLPAFIDEYGVNAQAVSVLVNKMEYSDFINYNVFKAQLENELKLILKL